MKSKLIFIKLQGNNILKIWFHTILYVSLQIAFVLSMLIVSLGIYSQPGSIYKEIKLNCMEMLSKGLQTKLWKK